MSFITHIHITSLLFPLKKPFSNHLRKITHIKGLEIRINTYNDIEGHGFIYNLSDMPYAEIISLLELRIIPKLLDESNFIENYTQLMSYWKKIWPSLKAEQRSQSELTALAIVDIAIWDIFLKSKKVSLHQFFGGAQSKIAAYATTGWLSFTTEELISECKEFKDKGINAFKIRLGHKEDVSRVKKIREAMGNDFTLMLDANQRYGVQEAIKISKELYTYNMLWLEEPTINKLETIAEVKKSSFLPIALGENIIEENDFKLICQNKLTDILQLDLPRCGGITGFIRIAEIATKFQIPICNHLLYELSTSLVAAYKNGLMIECDNLLPPEIFKNKFEFKNGYIEPPTTYGNGVEITEAALLKYGISTHTIQPTSRISCRL